MTEHKPKIIILAGPTASGKTAVSLEIAHTFDAEIVSADSIQIYKYMDIGSAKPTPAERAATAHHMIDIRYPDEEFSAGDYVRDARTVINNILQRGRVPLVVGGTGLYIRLLLGGVAELPPMDIDLRDRLKSIAEKEGAASLYEKLRNVDPEIAHSIPENNVVRIIRALEVFELTGKKFSQIQKEHSLSDRPYDRLFICMDPGRSYLYERIDHRVDNMIKGGLLDEVIMLWDRGYHRDLKPMQSLGYRHAGMILARRVSPDEGVDLMKRDTRHYAKRQFTWFRSEPDVFWLGPDKTKGIGLIISKFLGR